jgi:hypothetical protein
VNPTRDELKDRFREAYRKVTPNSDAISVVMLVAAKQEALTAGVSLRELQEIEYELRRESNA